MNPATGKIDGSAASRQPTECPSFPRKRESGISRKALDSRFRRNDGRRASSWELEPCTPSSKTAQNTLSIDTSLSLRLRAFAVIAFHLEVKP